MSIDNRQKGLVEAGLHGRRRRFAVTQLFADALEHKHVRIHAHADRQNHTGNARQGQDCAKSGQHSHENDQVQH